MQRVLPDRDGVREESGKGAILFFVNGWLELEHLLPTVYPIVRVDGARRKILCVPRRSDDGGGVLDLHKDILLSATHWLRWILDGIPAVARILDWSSFAQ